MVPPAGIGQDRCIKLHTYACYLQSVGPQDWPGESQLLTPGIVLQQAGQDNAVADHHKRLNAFLLAPNQPFLIAPRGVHHLALNNRPSCIHSGSSPSVMVRSTLHRWVLSSPVLFRPSYVKTPVESVEVARAELSLPHETV